MSEGLSKGFTAAAVSQAAAVTRAAILGTISRFTGRVDEVKGGFIVAAVPNAVIGHLCDLYDPEAGIVGQAEIISIDGDKSLLAPFDVSTGLSRRIEVSTTGEPPKTRITAATLGCVVDWRGGVVTRFAQSGEVGLDECRYIRVRPPESYERRPITKPFDIGVRAVNSLMTVGEGQRVGVFGGAGTGKSSLVDIVLNGSSPDILVLALIGERGREVAELTSRLKQMRNAARTTVFTATSDRPAAERLNTIHAATACAEVWRDQGKQVLLVVDSVTRVARALREIGLARGEMPTRRGFPVSVFEQLPMLFERAGRLNSGSITAIYTVLVEGEIADDPVAEETMSLIDGHIVLSKAIAAKGIYPPIDVSKSLSRSMSTIVDADHKAAAREYRALGAAYDDIEVMLRMGEYQQGSDPMADRAIKLREQMTGLIRQELNEIAQLGESVDQLRELCR